MAGGTRALPGGFDRFRAMSLTGSEVLRPLVALFRRGQSD
jgi:hypothetical protein